MKRAVRVIIVFIALAAVMWSHPVRAIDTAPAPPRLESSPLMISAYSTNQDTLQYVELYNNTSDIVNLKGWTLHLDWSESTGAPGATVTLPLSINLTDRDQYIPAKHYAVVGINHAVAKASIDVTIKGLVIEAHNYISQIKLANTAYKPYTKSFSSVQTQPMRLNETTTGYTTTGSYSADTRPSLYDDGLYEVGVSSPSEFPLAPSEILANPRSCSPLEVDVACHEYVEFHNDTALPVSFENTRLRIGTLGSGGTTVPLSGMLAPGQFMVFDKTETGAPLSITNSGGYVWLEDVYGLKQYNNTVTAYADASSSTHKGQSWAKLGNVWQWTRPSPGNKNQALPVEKSEQTETHTSTSSLVPCKANQYRSSETNRCRLRATATTSLSACAANQYRSLETNRCRLIASSSTSSSSLKACAPNQYRNAATNRCRLIATATNASLKPCTANQVRNPDTNRCKKLASSTIPDAAFPVKSIFEASSSPVGWLSFAAVGALAVSYAMWEWRSEIVRGFRGIGRLMGKT